MGLTSSSQIRVEVLELRIRLELLAAAAFDNACRPATTGRQSNVARRLLFLLDGVPHDRADEAYRLVKLGAHVMKETSNILHGRSGMIDLPRVIVDEWREVVEQLEALLHGSRL